MADTPHLPPVAAWRHHGAREGFEVAFFDQRSGNLRVKGHTAAVEHGEAFAVRYAIELDERWHSRSAQISGQAEGGARSVTIEGDGRGRWLIEGRAAPSSTDALMWTSSLRR